jgi:hypothetical protein
LVVDGTAAFLQLRPSHNIHFHFLAVQDFQNDKSHFFVLDHQEMIDFISKYSGGLCHGTKGEHGPMTMEQLHDPKLEFALHPKIGSNEWNALLHYTIREDEINERKVWEARKQQSK